jgi:hypothetical protein
MFRLIDSSAFYVPLLLLRFRFFTTAAIAGCCKFIDAEQRASFS